MSRNILVSLCAIATMGLAACGGGADDDDGNGSAPDAAGGVTADAATSDPDAAVSVADAGSPDADVSDPCDLCAAEATCEVDVCTCPAGFAGDGTTAGTGCADVDECADGTSDCTLSCANIEGSFTCNDRVLASHRDSATYDLLSIVYDPDPAIVDTVTVESTETITGAGAEIITGTTGAATDPTTGNVYLVTKDDVGGRHLVQLDLATNIATFIGALAQPVASIAFDDAGVLYGITGLQADPNNELSTISLVDATLTPILALADGASADGETLASRRGDPLMYRWSGNDPYDFQSVDSLGVTVDLLQPTLPAQSEKTAAVFSDIFDAFLVTGRDELIHVYRLDETGENLPFTAANTYKGLTFVPAPPVL